MGIALFNADAEAQSRSLQSGPVVRRQLLFRSDRLEVSPMIASSIAPVYQRTIFLTVAGRYHLTNAFSLGLNANVGGLNLNTSVARNYEDSIVEIPGSRRPSLEYATPLLLTDFHLSFVPLHGKVNLFNNILHWDFYLTAGVGGALISSDSDDLSGFEFGPAIGVGLRTFVSDKFAVNVLFQDYLYSSADAQEICCGPRGEPREVNDRFRSHVVGGAGVSIFFPSDVRVSR
jgi:outer membrane beta-barrel protein